MTAELARLAVAEVEAAVAGRVERADQWEMLRIEAQVPGFGGFYVIGSGEVVALLKTGARTIPDEVRRSLAVAYGARRELVRQAMASAARAQIRPADYSLSELIAIQKLITYNSRSIAGWTGVGADIPRNRVWVFFQDSAAMESGLSFIHALGVPRSALLPKLIGPVIQPICVTTRARMDSLRRSGRAGC